MRTLHRIIFINSANIPYADDIYLDGNVHFIGTQGVGKSTVLRAILFFYNADTQKLGISVEKQTYTDYYFPYSNSYIIYEVNTEQGPFCILSFKQMNRVCYRFIDAPYRPEFFIDEHRVAYSETERIRAMLDQYGVNYSRLIYTYEEYRNILYGNNPGVEFARYALMESKQFQNIPRTIQNVLLNSKLDAEFIKKTLISSLNEEETAIDLNSYKELLKNFDTRLRDIQEFQKRETQRQSREIVRLSTETTHLQSALVQHCRELWTAHQKAERALPDWKVQLSEAEREKSQRVHRKMELQEESRRRSDQLQEQLAVRNNELKKALAKEKDYSQQHMDEIIERSARKDEWKNRQAGLLEEQRILTSQHLEISTKYKSLTQALDEQRNRIHEAKIRQQEVLNQTFNEQLEQARSEYQQATDALYREMEERSQQLHPLKAEKQNEQNALDYRIRLCRKEAFFETEQQEIKARIESYTHLHLERKNRIGQAQLRIQELTLAWDSERRERTREREEKQQAIQLELAQLRPRLKELAAFLEHSKETLQGWLKEHKKGWETNIGKLCDERILWQQGLFPQLALDEGNSFYGIQLQLDQIDRPIRSIDDYEAEQQQGEVRLQELTAALQRLTTEQEENEEQLKRKFQPQVKEQKTLISQLEYELKQLERQYQQDMLDLEEWKKKAQQERTVRLAELEEEQQRLLKESQKIEKQLAHLNKDKNKRLETLQKSWLEQKQKLHNEKQQQQEILTREEQQEKERIAATQAQYEAERQQELHSQGADTERLQDIARQLADIEKELTFIKEHATLLIEYRKDKRDLIDHIPGWQREHDELERQLQNERQNLRTETASLQTEIDRFDKQLQEATEQVSQLEKNLEAYSKIPAYDWYRPHQDFFREGLKDSSRPSKQSAGEPVHTPSDETGTGLSVLQTTRSCLELIDELTRLSNQFTQVQSKLRKEVNLFTGHFDETNTFKFPVKFNEDWEYIRFADELHDFVEERRIDEYVRRINNEHWDTFKRISMDTTLLTASEDDIQEVIHRVNEGFATCNFVGVIQRIEMKVEESSNRVVSVLRDIQKYYQTYGYDLSPETNLFSSPQEQLVKEEAIGLLRNFIQEIHAYRNDKIRLYDSFELRFRIVENGNDTGFIEKIANVGSEGTDILVKAMINIMLLNVFKEGASRKFKDFQLHCMMDEIGKLHPTNVSGILKFANDRNIILINGSPTELNREAYKHVYLLTKGAQNKTRIARLISEVGA